MVSVSDLQIVSFSDFQYLLTTDHLTTDYLTTEHLKKGGEEMKCPQCGKEFEPKVHNQKYCSSKCHYAVGHKKQPLKKKICAECGKEFETSRSDKIYCSSECYQAVKLKRNRKKPLEKKICEICGKEFETSLSYQKYCSLECQQAANKKPLEKKICPNCGKEFETSDSRKIYCSLECQQAAYKKNQAVKNQNRTREKRICVICGKEFEPSRSYYKCCSAECSEKNVKRLMEQHNEKMKEQRARQKLELQAAREKAKAKLERYYQDKELPKDLPVTVLSPGGTSRRLELTTCNHSEYPVRKCAYCGLEFVPNSINQKCCNDCKKLKKLSPKEANKEFGKMQMRQMIKEADECGLSYAKYKYQREVLGRSYEELLAERQEKLNAAPRYDWWRQAN